MFYVARWLFVSFFQWIDAILWTGYSCEYLFLDAKYREIFVCTLHTSGPAWVEIAITIVYSSMILITGDIHVPTATGTSTTSAKSEVCAAYTAADSAILLL